MRRETTVRPRSSTRIRESPGRGTRSLICPTDASGKAEAVLSGKPLSTRVKGKTNDNFLTNSASSVPPRPGGESFAVRASGGESFVVRGILRHPESAGALAPTLRRRPCLRPPSPAGEPSGWRGQRGGSAYSCASSRTSGPGRRSGTGVDRTCGSSRARPTSSWRGARRPRALRARRRSNSSPASATRMAADRRSRTSPADTGRRAAELRRGHPAVGSPRLSHY